MRLRALYCALAMIVVVDALAFAGLGYLGGGMSIERIIATVLPVAFTAVLLHLAVFVGMCHFLYLDVTDYLRRARETTSAATAASPAAPRPVAPKPRLAKSLYDGLYNPS